ncbi:glycoside hydrolase family 16 protein [Nocardioides immobilis]|uniref:Glycoside hydrolase family 16 protein n=1 Tax=Nocardioides immobilis TaxID=2049295 RepID=A0A417Y2U3_9ACTN|nr:glycoside hydrolase family 16 protein [Nocardioides immobilis]RHW26895.1 glycoside hydrolase family 16 protein [Nocardioides immobilis]
MTERRSDVLTSVRRTSRVLAATALVGIAGLAPLQAGSSPGGAAAAVVASDVCGAVLPKADGTTWSCSFVDNFDGSALDTTRWGIQQTALTGFRTGQTCYTASTKNIALRRGALELTARAEKGRFSCQSPSGDFTTSYTGGMIGTRGRFSQAFGRFEVRAKFPTARTAGVHGGFWMNPDGNTYGPWPASGEIDVAEWWSNEPTLVLPSLHYNGSDSSTDSGWGCRVPDVSVYHTYTVEWLPTGMRFFIDGGLCFARTWTPDSPLIAPQPFDKPFTMILNMGVGTATGINAVSSTAPLPAVYSVDYAKAWR